MKRILHVSKYYYPFRGGTEAVCQDFAEGLMDDFENKIICFNHLAGDKVEYVNGIEVIRCGCFCKVSSQSLSLTYYSRLKDIINNWKPDAIHFHHPNPFIAALLLQLLPKQVKLVVHWHLDIFKQRILYFFLKGLEKKLLERADKIIVTSEKYRDDSIPLKNYLSKTEVIYNGIDTTRLQKKVGDDDRIRDIKKRYYNFPILFFVGRHVPYKGLKYLIEAEKYIKGDCHIVIAGEGPLTDKLKKMARKDRITFVGKLSEDDLRAYLYAADIFVFPSITKNEAFGLALAEAMYCGCVPVTFTIPGSGVNIVSINGETGIEVPNRDIVAYAEAIDNLLKNRDVLEYYSKEAKKRVENLFTVFQEKTEAIRFYKQLFN